ncbi:hypothetical protein D4740_12375 [Actinomyces sp. 2119]|uniref:hypothetical protein n=1 Tax=Actinomyces sp. 2119 TaxID=2321393 RepID=UPI000E6C34A7|nr:hypothetical protein [Actinomyces sp. 2119]RJF40213.1 hypothetical protein D4740_12375 [Actinomyces sp. 2119]
MGGSTRPWRSLFPESYWNHNAAFHGELVAPGCRLLVIGLAARKSVADWALDLLGVVPIRCASLWYHETPDIDVPTAPARESLRHIGATARRTLPGARVRRRFYWRYSIVWDRPDRQQW